MEAQVQFLELIDAYAAELPEQPQLADLIEAVLRQIEDDRPLLLTLQDEATGGFVAEAADPTMQIDHTQHAISALLGAASAIGR